MVPSRGRYRRDGSRHQRAALKIYQAEDADLRRSQSSDPLLRHLTRVLVAEAVRRRPPPGTAVDLGCGLGRTAIALAAAGYDVTALDPSTRAIEMARADTPRWLAGRLHLGVADGLAPVPAEWRGAFDLAVCSEVIEHVATPEAVVGWLWGVLRPGGLLLLTTPYQQRQWTVMDDYAGHLKRFSVTELESLLARFELLDLTTEGFPFQRLVMWTYDRTRPRSRPHQFSGFGYSLPYRVYQVTMSVLLRVDHLLRRLRRGTTLVAIARKR